MSRILMVVMVSEVYTYLHTHEVVYTKYVQLFTFKSYLNNFFLIVLVWFSSEADLKAETQEQVVYLEVRETLVGQWGRETGKRRQPSRKSPL